MAQITITLSGPEMTQLNQAKAKAGFATLEEFATHVLKDQANDKKVIEGYAKANQVEAKRAAADADKKRKDDAAEFAKAQRKAATKKK